MSRNAHRPCAGGKADLLIMGGFGHARFKEMLLGGVTQSMLCVRAPAGVHVLLIVA